jgi:Na+-translocating ferredoxin:NAD+ oxidoreductase RnfD subunit
MRHGHKPPCYGMLVGALNLLFFRSFSTLDNPCAFVSLAFICGRLLKKLRKTEFAETLIDLFDVLLDAAAVGILSAFGVFPQYDCDEEAWAHMLLLLCAVFVFVHHYGGGMAT